MQADQPSRVQTHGQTGNILVVAVAEIPGVSSRNSASPPRGVIVIDADEQEDSDDENFYWD
jgi:ribosomal 30S subunit maturation factor RimM